MKTQYSLRIAQYLYLVRSMMRHNTAQAKIIEKKFHKFKNNSYLCKANNKTQNNMVVVISELSFMQSPKEGDKLAKVFDALELEWEQLDTDNSHIIVTTCLSLVEAMNLRAIAEMACAK